MVTSTLKWIKNRLYRLSFWYIRLYNPKFDPKLPTQRDRDLWTVDAYARMAGRTDVERREIYSPIACDYVTGHVINKVDSSSDEEPNLITSICKLSDFHYPVLDLDFPAMLLPSINSRHSHLYLDCGISWEKYVKLLEVLAECNIIESGYAAASIAKGFTAVRRPAAEKVYEMIESEHYAAQLREFVSSKTYSDELV